ncbi:NUDIX hydrolase [Streptomyces sp. SDT5-1]|uniref:NUDIX hydrolase n=1 Tax=Streptomyces sp. SDT5-1 TaxID=3406418 RepID=UPI003FD492E4
MNEAPSRDASVVAAIDDEQQVTISSSYSLGMAAGSLFLPGGRREAGEDAAACARRELREEAGVTSRSARGHLWTATP